MTDLHAADGDLLFVYGTLMHATSGNKMADLLRANSEHLGAAQMQGKLYRVNHSYPGVTDSDDPDDVVHGDLFRLDENADKVIAALDLYEDIGGTFSEPYEYRRERRQIQSDDGTVTAWVYIYNWPIEEATRITNGRFIA